MCGLKKGSDEGCANVHEAEPIFESDTSDVADSGQSTPTVPVLKRRKVRFNPITLSSDDPRLTYARRYVEAINSCDPAAVLEMLRDLAIPKVVSVKKKLNPDPNFFLPLHIEVLLLLSTQGFPYHVVRSLVLKLLQPPLVSISLLLLI